MSEAIEHEFYQIRLFRNGEIEIFQNVFFHKVHFEDSVMKAIEVRYSSSRNIGNSTHSIRPMDGIYDVKLLDDAEYCPWSDFLPQNIKIIIH